MSDNSVALPQDNNLAVAEQAANRVATRYILDDYRSRTAENRIRCQRADLAIEICK